MTTTVLNAEEYGGFSNHWMIAQVAKHVPRESLERVMALSAEYVSRLGRGEDVISPADMLDVMAQVLLTNDYYATAYPVRYAPRGTAEQEDDYGDDEHEETVGEKWLRENAITEEEIEAAAEYLDDWPDADDPMEGFRL